MARAIRVKSASPECRALSKALVTSNAPQKPPHEAILVMHQVSKFLNTPAGPELSKRGFMVLGMNPPSDNSEALVPGQRRTDHDFLLKCRQKRRPMCQGAKKFWQFGNQLASLPKTDGLTLVDAHPGMRTIAPWFSSCAARIAQSGRTRSNRGIPEFFLRSGI